MIDCAIEGLRMASFKSYVREDMQPGSRMRVWTQVLFWLPVGHGTITAYDPFAFTFEGTIASILYSGDLVIALELLDRDAGAPAGPCFMGLNDRRSVSSTYRTEGERLIIAASFDEYDQAVAIGRSRCGRYTLLTCSGRYNTVVRLEPEN